MKKLGSVLVLMAAAACSGGDPASDSAAASETIIDGSPTGEGVLRFLNHPSTTLAVLDHQVPLPSHTAANLIAFRAGDDALLGTGDDVAFDDLDDVLAVEQVGHQRLAKIAAFAKQHGFVPEGDELLGVYDGVAFTVNEAEATLALVNSATRSELDDEIGLDKRAVDSIMAAGKILSIKQLAKLYWVSQSALEALKAAANGGACSAHSLPAATSYTESCTDRIAEVLTAPETARTTSPWTTDAESCGVSADTARWVDLYVDYWLNVIGVPEMVIGDDEPRQFRVVVSRRGDAGRVVSVDIGGDEDRLDLVMDHDDALLAYYQHNQSADAAFHCGVDGESSAVAPDPECLGTAVINFEDDSPLAEQGSSSDFSTHDPLVAAVVADFKSRLGLDDAATIAYDYALYERPVDEDGLSIALSSDGASAHYLAANRWGEEPFVLTRDDGAGSVWLCQGL